MEIKDFDAVIFDMDGVLIDSEPLWKIAIIKVFGSVGIDLTIEDCARTVGLRLDEVVAFRFRERPWTGKSQQEIIDEIMAEMVHQISTQGKPISGVLESLKYFKNHGLKIALATSSFHELMECTLNTLDITHYFESALSAEQLPYGKPHPEVYINSAKNLEVAPERCLVIEDSFNGMIAGMAAQMKVCVIPEKSHIPNPKLELAHFFYEDLNALMAAFEEV